MSKSRGTETNQKINASADIVTFFLKYHKLELGKTYLENAKEELWTMERDQCCATSE